MTNQEGLIENEGQSLRFNRLEKSWIMYDVGNSAFTLLSTTILPLFFNALAKEAGIADENYLAYWGYTHSITTIIVVLLGPILGAIADNSGSKKKIFAMTVLFGVLTMCGLALPVSWFTFLVFFVIARVGYQSSLIFYDSMLTDVTKDGRMDKLSSYGYALGYIGSVVPFILSLLVVLGKDRLGINMQIAMAIAIAINAIWWLLFTVPLFKNYKQKNIDRSEQFRASMVFVSLWRTLKNISQDKKILFFLLAFFFYIDGVYTIIDMAVSYGDSIGLDSQSLLLALLLTQFVAFPFAILFGKLAKKYPNHVLIQICIVAYTLITAFAVQLDKEWEFWFLAVMVGMFQGGVQALSRSYFGQLIPRHKSSEYFALYDIFGKGASITGTTLVAVVSQITGRQQLGILAIVVLFVIGFLLFRISVKQERTVYTRVNPDNQR